MAQSWLTRARLKTAGAAILLFILIGYVLPLWALYSFQRTLIYFPNTTPVGDPAEFGLKDMQVVPVTTADGLTHHDWFRPPKNGDKYTIILFHGAYVSLGNIAIVTPFLLKMEHGLFLCEYRGFGDSPGKPTEEGVYADARAAVKWLTDHGYKADHLIFYGSSLGTGVAVQMAMETTPGMLILHSPYARVADIAKIRFPMVPVDLLLKDRFDSVDKISKVHAPVLILHGMEDNIIPIENAHKLFEAANSPKTFFAVKQFKHNDLLFNSSIYKPISLWIDAQIKATAMGSH